MFRRRVFEKIDTLLRALLKPFNLALTSLNTPVPIPNLKKKTKKTKA
jgi:hypothetical protein